MSYEFYMAFAKAETISDAYQIAHSFVNEYLTFDRMKEIIKENLYSIPSIKWSCHCDERRFASEADRYWVYSLFNCRFLYWEEYQLLALAKDWQHDTPYFTQPIMFYNGSDTNLKFEYWPQNIPFFQHEIDKFKKILELPLEEAVEALNQNGYPTDLKEILDAAEEEPENAEDIKRYCLENKVYCELYADIFKKLDLDNYLYHRKEPRFKLFSVNAITSSDMDLDLSLYTKRFVNRELNNIDSMRAKIIPVFFREGNALLLFQIIRKYDEQDPSQEEIKKTIDAIIQEYLETELGKRFLGIYHQMHDNKAPSAAEIVGGIPQQYFSRHGLYPLKKAYLNTVFC